ncbi:MAG: MerR family transcriptional regulator [Novosphingobium sp.]
MRELPGIFDFDDGKAPDALRTIGEVAQALGIRQHVLRYWEEQFPALQPIKRSGGRRYYRPQDVALIAEIDRLVHREGYTLRGACKAITDNTAPPAQAIDTPVSGGALRERLVAIRQGLAEALAAA